MRTLKTGLAKLDRCGAPLLATLVAALGAAVLGCQRGASPGLVWDDDVVHEIEAWREQHETDYRRDWATLEGLHFLKPGTQTAGSERDNDLVLTAAAPPRVGRFTVAGRDVTFDPEPGVVLLTVNGKPAAATKLRDDDGDDPDEIEANGLSIVLHRTGERLALRVRDPNGEHARTFRGFEWFPINRDYRVVGQFIRDSVPHEEHVVNTFGDIDTYTSEGIVQFTLNNQILKLRPFTTRPGHLYIVFADATSGIETYEAARFLTAELRDDGTAILDFNRAYNPPCAFNPFTTCPIPLRQNELRANVRAGEKKYPEQVEVPSSLVR